MNGFYDAAREKSYFIGTLPFYVVFDGAKEKTHFNIIFWMLSMMEEEKTLIVLENYFFYIVYDGGKEKTRSFVQFIFLWCLWWSRGKNSFCYNVIFCMLSLMKQEKKLILTQHYFLYVVYNGGREKTDSVIQLFFVCVLWWSKRRNSLC